MTQRSEQAWCQVRPLNKTKSHKYSCFLQKIQFSLIKQSTFDIRHIQVLPFSLRSQYLIQRTMSAAVTLSSRSGASCFTCVCECVHLWNPEVLGVCVWKVQSLVHRSLAYIWLRKGARPFSRWQVRISQPVSVTSRVCSNWAERLPSLVTAVQPSGHVSSCQPPETLHTRQQSFGLHTIN